MPEQTLFELIHTIEKVTYKMLVHWKEASDIDLGITHILVLHELHNRGDSRPSDLAKTLHVTPASLTHLSTKLLKWNLITRTKDETDRRTTYWAITEKGADLLKKAQMDGQQLHKQFFAHLTPEEQETLLRIYQKLDSALG
ncbi:MarR family winged helix-turn-helix transcriptional regulator [Sporosarcina sp. Te-1]|uniref:MarR family winged helix-turn-helix transcriptional regulator n=1 Tax=Sporosarcina sp. Te-1 TaxID=2818390 RepID=UPI001A9E1CC6|nr:MarR family transcriptional regulator [Sporosarcina sp. Te-1]QTD41985.1 MarR family transcriptional regulator [Sporosarcina sp. Te-1]